MLYTLGLEKEVVGITAYCVHPKHWLKEKTVIGGTKDLQLDKIRSLKPDLIIGNREENIKEQIETLADIPTYISDIESVDDALYMIEKVGSLTHTSTKAKQLVEDIKSLRAQLNTSSIPRKRVAYFIWHNPMMLAGQHTFIGKMLEACGFENAAPESTGRYPQIPFDKIPSLKADVLLLSSEPFHFTTKELHQLAKTNPNSLCKIVDGELFSWYGSRMKKAFVYFKKLQAEMALH